MARQFSSDTAREEKKQFDRKAGSTAGKDTVVGGHLSGIAGSTQKTYGGDKPQVREKLDEAAKKTPENPQR
jgi:hypothetical protein